MNVPPLDELKRIAPESILNFITPRAKTRFQKTGIGPGRYSHGPHVEDIAFLIVKYTQETSNSNRVDTMIPLDDVRSLIIQQMVGIPAKRISRNLNTDSAASKLQSVFNSIQNNWRFKFDTRRGVAGVTMEYSVMDISLIGGNEGGLGGILDL